MKRGALWIFLVALFVRLLFSFLVQMEVGEDAFFHPQDTSDAGQYVRLAQNILYEGTFMLYGEPHSFRTPGYPAWLAFWYWLSGGSWFLAVAVVQSILGALVAVMTYYIGRAVFSRSVGLGAGWLFALEPYGVHMAARPMTETLYAFLIALLALCVVGIYKKPRWSYGALAGVVVGLAILVRPQMWPFYIVFVLIFFLSSLSRKNALVMSGVFLVSVAVIVLPWIARNERLFGQLDVSSQGGWNLYFYDAKRFTNSERGFGMSGNELRDFLAEKLGRRGPEDVRSLVYQPIYYSEALTIIKKHPVKFAAWHTKESLIFFADDGIRDALRHVGVESSNVFILAAVVGMRIFWVAVFLLAAFGLWRARGDRIRLQIALFFTLTILYVPAVAGTLAVARFRYPMTPILFVLAAGGFAALYKWRKYA